MDLNNFKAFVAVAQERSFSLAAERLHLSQPAISKRIASLEHLWDVKLFDRIGHQVCLTETGKALLPKAQHILDEVLDAKSTIQNLNGNMSGHLSLGVSYYIEEERLEKLLGSFVKAYPDVQLDLSFIGSKEAPEIILGGGIDLALVTLPNVDIAGIETKSLWHDELKIVINKTHPLNKKSKISKADLIESPAILIDPIFNKEVLISSLGLKHNNIPVATTSHYFRTAKMLVSLGIGWSVLPEHMISQNLKVIELANFKLGRELGFVYHSQRTLSHAAKALLAHD